MPGTDRASRWLLADQQALFADRSLQLLVMPRINTIERGAQHSHRATAGTKAAPMCSRINAISEPAHHWPARLGQGGTQVIRKGLAVAGRATGADDRHRLPTGQKGPDPALTRPAKNQRWALQIAQIRGPGRIPGHQHAPSFPHLLSPSGQGTRPPVQTKRLYPRSPARADTGQILEVAGRGEPGLFQAAEALFKLAQPDPADARAGRPEQPPKTTVPPPWPRSTHRGAAGKAGRAWPSARKRSQSGFRRNQPGHRHRHR